MVPTATSADGNAQYRFEIEYEHDGDQNTVVKETIQPELSDSAAKQLAGHAALDRGADVHKFNAQTSPSWTSPTSTPRRTAPSTATPRRT